MTANEIVEKLKEINAKDVSRRTGIPYDRMAKWIQGKGAPKQEDHRILEAYFNGNSSISKKLIPLWEDVGSIGGINLVAEDQPVYYPTSYIDAGDLFPGATAAIRHYGDSMKEYPSGCLLFLQDIERKDTFVWGQNYVIEYLQYRITKKVQRGKDKRTILAKSTNHDTYPNGDLIHEPIEVKIDDIRRLCLVLGHLVREHSSGIVCKPSSVKNETS